MAEKTIDKGNLPVQTEAKELQTTREDDRYLVPAVDIFETDGGLTLVADVPGVDKGGLDVRVEDDLLTIQGKIAHVSRKEPSFREFQLATYWRQFQLSDTVDQEKIGAVLKHGVLTLTLPWAEKVKPKQIDVTIS